MVSQNIANITEPVTIQLAWNSTISIFCARDVADCNHHRKRSSTTPNIGRQPFVAVQLSITPQAGDLPASTTGYTNSYSDTYTESKTSTQNPPYFFSSSHSSSFPMKQALTCGLNLLSPKPGFTFKVWWICTLWPFLLKFIFIHTNFLPSHTACNCPHAPIVTGESVLFVLHTNNYCWESWFFFF